MSRCLIIIVISMLLLAAATSDAQVFESGSLRAFLLGDEPAAEYDNWLSHTVEGLATEDGYNHYMPPELDPQTNGFGSFRYIDPDSAEAQRTLWRQVFTHFWNDEPDAIEQIFADNEIPYEVVYFTDSETGVTFRMLREELNMAYVDTGYYAGPEDDVSGSFDLGWGLFIYNPESSLPWAEVQVVHINDDFICVPFATSLFLDGGLGTIALHGTGREVMWEEDEDYNNNRSLSDPSRNGNLPLQWFTEFVIDTVRAQGERDLTIQIHSYDSESHEDEPTIQVSCGQDDGYPNRPARDISWLGYDWVNFTPEIAVPAGYSMPRQEEVTVGDYYAVWRGDGLYHWGSDTQVSRNVQLPGYPHSPQMIYASQGYNKYEPFDRWLHFELDELPAGVEDADYSELNFYSGTRPPTLENWEPMLRYYEAAEQGLIAYLEDVANPFDDTPPTGPSGLSIFYAGDDFVELTWSGRAYDPNFATYEVYYGTGLEIDTTDDVWTVEDDPDLVGQNITFTTVSGLQFGQGYGFRVRGVDMFGNAGELCNLAHATTIEGDQPPLPFTLLTPLDGDTCRTLDTTLTWEATTDPDLYDTPHYDVWLDTLPDLSTAWVPEDADSLADTTFALTGLLNRKTYYWTVRATDRNTPGTWANDTLSIVTYHPLPPAPFSLLLPMDRETLWGDTTVTLAWNSTRSQDDPDAEIGYIVQWANDPGFTGMVGSEDTADTTFTIDGLQQDSTYWWKVLAYDDRDTIECDAVWKFYVWEHDPPLFALSAPENGEFIDDDTVTVSWTVPDETGLLGANVGGGDREQWVRGYLRSLSAGISNDSKGSVSYSGEGWAELDNQGGPDNFGHVWIDNEQPGGPLFDWVEINETGTMSAVSDIDDGTEVVTLPFTFPYFGDSYDNVVISSNGNIHFGAPDNDFHHYPIPDPAGPDGIIAPWWIDLRPNVRGNIYYYGDDRRFIVEWDDCREYSHEDWLYTFQVILYPTGRIEFLYKSMIGGVANATIGIENIDEDDGLMMAFNADYVADRLAVSITFEDWLYNVQWSADENFTNLMSVYTFANEFSIGEIALQELFGRQSGLSELDELPDDTTVYWRVSTMNLFGQESWATPGEEGRWFRVYIQQPPGGFELAWPANNDTVLVDTVTVTWNPSADPDPLDTVSYHLEWSPSLQMTPVYEVVTQDTFFTITGFNELLSQLEPRGKEKRPNRDSEIRRIKEKHEKRGGELKEPVALQKTRQHVILSELDELPDDASVFWRVSAQDQAGNVSWPEHGTDPWRFYIAVPEPPGAFALISPENGDTLTPQEAEELSMTWETSDDPDPGETAVYNLEMDVGIPNLPDISLVYNGLMDTVLVLNLADSLGLTEWTEPLAVTWRVTAVSGGDSTECETPFSFTIEPQTAAPDKPFDEIPREFSIASVFPNPFNQSTTVVIGLPKDCRLRVALYNILGRQVLMVADEQRQAGYQKLSFTADRLASGLYFITAEVNDETVQIRKIVLLR